MKGKKHKLRLFEVTPEKERIIFELKKIGVDPYALRMAEKALAHAIKICGLKPAQGNIIKQEALACGIDNFTFSIFYCSVSRCERR